MKTLFSCLRAITPRRPGSGEIFLDNSGNRGTIVPTGVVFVLIQGQLISLNPIKIPTNGSVSMPFINNLIKYLLIVLIVFLLIVSITGIFVVYCIPFDLAKSLFINRLNAAEYSSFFNELFYSSFKSRLHIVSYLFLVIACILYIIRFKLQEIAINIIYQVKPLLDDFQEYILTIKRDGIIVNATLLVIVIATIIIRILYLFRPICYDESYNLIIFASRPLYFLLSYYPYFNNHIFHTLLMHIFYLFAGVGQLWAIRLPAFFAGICMVPLSYFVGRLFYNKYAALIAAALVSSSSILIDYSTNARGYTLISLIFLISLSLATYLCRNRNQAAWLIFIILCAIGFFTIPIFLYPFAMIVVWMFFTILYQKEDSLMLLKYLTLSCLAIFILTIVLYTPVLIITGIDGIHDLKMLHPILVKDFIKNFQISLFSIIKVWNRDINLIISILLVIGFLVSICFHKKISRERFPLLLSLLLSILPIIIIQRVIPFERVWVFALPIYFIVSAGGLAFITMKIISKVDYKNTIFSALAIIILICNYHSIISNGSIYYSDQTGNLDAEKIAIFLGDTVKDRDVIITECPSDYPIMYYLRLHKKPIQYIGHGIFRGDKENNNIDQFDGKNLLEPKLSYVVVNKIAKQDIETILENHKINKDLYNVNIIKEYEFTVIYLIAKK
jgi:hypothetical protein